MDNIVRTLKKNRNTLLPLGIIIFLGVITLLTLRLTQERQELRSRAAADSAVLSFSPTSATAPVNGTFTVNVLLNTGGQAVIGSDILVQFDRNKLSLQNIAKPSGTHATFKTYAPVTSNGAFDTAKVITQANTNGVVEFGIVAFDYATEALTPAFNGVMSPVATLTFQVKSGASGTSTIQYGFVNASTTTDSNVVLNPPSGTADPEDILAAPTSTVAVTISGTASPQPSPSASPRVSPSATPRVTPRTPPTPRVSPSATPRVTPRPTPSATPRVSPTGSPVASPSGAADGSLTVQVMLQAVARETAPKTATVTLKLNGAVVKTQEVTITPNSAGVYTSDVITGIVPATYDIFVKGPIHLTKNFSGQSIVSGANTKNLTGTALITGDAFSNDRVDIFDYSQLVADFGSRMPSTGSNADFDIDGDVDIFDYSFIVANFNKTGDQ